MIWFMVTLKIYLQAVDKVLRDEAFNIAKNSRYDGYQRDLQSFTKYLKLTLSCEIAHEGKSLICVF